jgi:hypothetical protein
MSCVLTGIEERRLAIQAERDGAKSPAERNRMGQFATPSGLAEQIVSGALALLPPELEIRFLDPAIGTGAFYSALLRLVSGRRVLSARGFEIDAHYAVPARDLFAGRGLCLDQADFTRESAPVSGSDRFNLLIANPPYVRHHHLAPEEKQRLQEATASACGVRIGGLAGLYCYFMGLCHAWMSPDGIAAWLVPSEFMDVGYGKGVKAYLLSRVTLLRIHRFDPADVQFGDALVSSTVVILRNRPPTAGHKVLFTFGGPLAAPARSAEVRADILTTEPKWTRFPLAEARELRSGHVLGDFFTIKRGIATGDNRFFVLERHEIEARKLPLECFRPILPSPRYITGDEIAADAHGLPLLDRQLFVLDCRLPESEIVRRFPVLASYLDEGRSRGIHLGYLCRHRSPWYSQEARPSAPFVCTYMGRRRDGGQEPFRFFVNRSNAVAANVYLMLYPSRDLMPALHADPGLARAVLRCLVAIGPQALKDEGRVYGGGLHKLEPKELANVPADGLVDLLAPPATEQRLL